MNLGPHQASNPDGWRAPSIDRTTVATTDLTPRLPKTFSSKTLSELNLDVRRNPTPPKISITSVHGQEIRSKQSYGDVKVSGTRFPIKNNKWPAKNDLEEVRGTGGCRL